MDTAAYLEAKKTGRELRTLAQYVEYLLFTLNNVENRLNNVANKVDEGDGLAFGHEPIGLRDADRGKEEIRRRLIAATTQRPESKTIKDLIRKASQHHIDTAPVGFVRTNDSATANFDVKVATANVVTSLFSNIQRVLSPVTSPIPVTGTVTQNGIQTASSLKVVRLRVDGINTVNAELGSVAVEFTLSTGLPDDYFHDIQFVANTFRLKGAIDPATYHLRLFENTGEGASESFVVDVTVESVIPSKTNVNGIESVGFDIIGKTVQGTWVWTGLGAGGTGQTLREGWSAHYNYDISVELDIGITWEGFAFGGGNRIVNTVNHEEDVLAFKVSEFDSILASQVAAMDGAGEGDIVNILNVVSQVVSTVGMVTATFSGPIGGGLIALGAVLAGTTEIIDASEHGDKLEMITGIISASVGAIGVIHGLRLKIGKAFTEFQKLEKMKIRRQGLLNEVAKAAETYNIPPEHLAPRVEIWTTPLEALPGNINDQVNKGVAGSSIGDIVAKNSNKAPVHAGMQYMFPDTGMPKSIIRGSDFSTGREVGAFTPTANKLTRVVVISEASDKLTSPDVAAFNAGVPGGRGFTNSAFAEQWWDEVTQSWRWNLDPETIEGNIKLKQRVEEAQAKGLANVAELALDETYAFRREGRRVLKSTVPLADNFLAKRIIRHYANGFGRYRLFSNNCQVMARELYKSLAGMEFPTWWNRSDETIVYGGYANDLNTLYMDLNPAEIASMNQSLLIPNEITIDDITGTNLPGSLNNIFAAGLDGGSTPLRTIFNNI